MKKSTAFFLAALFASRIYAAGQWFSAWTAAHGVRIAATMSGTSVRMIVRPSISGGAVRVKIENTFGQSPVVFSAGYIGQVQSGAAVVASSNTQLTFNGSASLMLAPGGGAYSDPLPFRVAAFQRYAISLDVASASDISAHKLGLVTNYMAVGTHAADPSASGFSAVPNGDNGSGAGPSFPFYWVAALDVQSTSNTGAIIALGDSITDGECSTRTNNGASSGTVAPDLYNRWTDLLAARFASLPANQSKAVADEGIAGNRVVASGGDGETALVRLDNDVLGREGATHVIFLEGTNDIANGAAATDVIAADQQIIASAHAAGLKIIGATILPRGADGFWTSAMETQRLALNNWIRNQANFTGIIDFDGVMQGGPVNAKNNSPSIPSQYACFDGVHPNSAGYAAMAGAINLSLFQGGGGGASVQLVPGSTTPLIQLNGENFQISANGTYFSALTNSRTLSTSGVVGTDLAYPVSLPDKTIFLYGDTFGAYQSGGNYFTSAGVGTTGADDSIASIPNVDLSQCQYVSDVAQLLAQGVTNPTVSFGACPTLHFYANPSPPAKQHIFQVIHSAGLLSGEGEGPFRVPTSGLVYNNRLYMFYITIYQAATPHFSLQSIVSKSDQDPGSWSDTNPPTFTRLYTVSSHPMITDPSNPPPQAGDTGEFMFNPPVVMDAATLSAAGLTQGLPSALQSASSVVFIFGSSYQYNRSNLYLAAFSLSDIEAGTSKWFYYKGNGQWSSNERDSAPLLSGGALGGQATLGNHSVKWNSALQRFVLMYDASGAILAQFSPTPWGPWTDPVTILSDNDTWGAKLLHHPGDQIVRSLITVYDSPGNAHSYGTDPGILYSPNLLDQFTPNADGSVTLYWTVSTWDPYVTFLMKSTFTPGSTPVIGAIENAEGGNLTIAPNTWIEIDGANLAPAGDSRIWQNADFIGGKMPTQLDGVSVTVNGKPAFVYYISPTQVNILTPPDAMQGSVPVALTASGSTTELFIAQAQALSLSFFVFNGGPYVAAVHANGSFIGPTTLYPGATTPAKPGETILLYANGFGSTSSPIVTGSKTQGGTLSPAPVIQIGGATANVQFAGLVAPGQFQFNVTVPSGLADGDQPIVAVYQGAATQSGTLLTVQH